MTLSSSSGFWQAARLHHLLLGLLHPPLTEKSPGAGEESAKELAAEIRYSLDTVYDMARTGRIPVAARKGRAIRFDLQAVRRALAS